MTPRLKILIVLGITLLASHPALAAGSNMPWETPLQAVLDSVEGPVVKIIAALMIIGCGLGMAFGDTGSAMRRAIQIVMGISIAFGATSFFLTWFGFGGGALI